MKDDLKLLLQASPRLWDLYTRREEYGSPLLDRHGRFPPPPGGGQELGRPLVSEFLVEHGFAPEYPDGRDFALCLTHDVDEVVPTRSHVVQSLTSAITRFPSLLRGEEKGPRLPWFPRTYRDFAAIMDLEGEYGGTSSFYFMATERDPFRFRYHIEDLAAELGEIRDRGWEVGVHGGYYSYTDESAIREEKARLEAALQALVHGYRNHFLRIRVPDTWSCLEKAGFLYDTTLGYPDTPGFRNGMCHPFRPVDLRTGREMNLLEIPLCMMDQSQALSTPPDLWERLATLMDRVAACRGVMTVLFHTPIFMSAAHRTHLRIYRKLLALASEKNGWIASGGAIAAWWRERGY
ncbi:MAG: polysaccharide deacetylase family protein [Methanomicrobiales archaeon]|nr:polysaccharide deacetylase family protein [Methanomicrobiales archaeon]MDD1654141.1 polysaccharide deacetylase family protein [Methanomicrobiales archaeon]